MLKLTALDLCKPDVTLDVAPHVEALGYARYWLTTHYGSGAYSSSPGIMAALVAATTETIRVGVAGVPLMYNAPLQVASDWKLLATMFPGRIDLGVMRSAGIARTESGEADQALVPPLLEDARRTVDFDERVEQLCGFNYGFAAGHPHAAIPVAPPVDADDGFEPPAVWILGSSVGSARLAARLGLQFSFAEFIGSRAIGVEAAATYRASFVPRDRCPEPHFSVSISGVCADDEATARARCAAFRGIGSARARPPLQGTRSQFAAFLSELCRDYDADEVVFADLCEDVDAKRRSYELAIAAAG